ncbi:MAG: hypothetical protein WC554_13290 [Clostridia bacterium]|jgi:hypothetical protein
MSEYDLNKQVSDVIDILVDINTQIYNEHRKRMENAQENTKKPQPEEPKIKFAIAGTKEAELPGVVVLELVHGWLNPEKIYLHCKDYSSGYLLGINMYTGKVNRVPGVGESFGFTLGDWGKLVIE